MCQARKVEIETTKAVPMQVDSCGIMLIIIIIIMWHHPIPSSISSIPTSYSSFLFALIRILLHYSVTKILAHRYATFLCSRDVEI